MTFLFFNYTISPLNLGMSPLTCLIRTKKPHGCVISIQIHSDDSMRLKHVSAHLFRAHLTQKNRRNIEDGLAAEVALRA